MSTVVLCELGGCRWNVKGSCDATYIEIQLTPKSDYPICKDFELEKENCNNGN